MIKKKLIKNEYDNDSKILIEIGFFIPTIITIFEAYREEWYYLIGIILIGEIIGEIISFRNSKAVKIDKSDYNFQYYRENNFNSEPAIAAKLIQRKETDTNDLLATILNLVNKGYIIINRDKEKNIIKSIEKNEPLILTLNKDKNIDLLLDFEKDLIKWFFIDYNVEEFNLRQLKDLLKRDEISGQRFLGWKNFVRLEFNKKNYLEFSKKGKTMKAILRVFMILLFLISIFIMIDVIPIMPFICVIIAQIITIKYFHNIKEVILSEVGKKEFNRIQRYIKFIKEYSLMKDTSMESIIIWNNYLTYSIAFNITDKINHQLENIIGEELYLSKY